MKYKAIFLGFVLLLAVSSFAACGSDGEAESGAAQGEEASASFQTISAKQAYQRMGADSEAVIVDVRTKDEYSTKHIGGAILIPNEDINDQQPALLPDLDAEILLYCRSGNRSRQAAEKLVKLGYTNVFDFGGINDWPYDTVTGVDPGEPVSKPEGDTSNEVGFSNFTAQDLDGNEVDESIFADYDLTMINLWATFCGPCLEEMPDLAELSKEYADQKVQIIGIPVDTLERDGSLSAKQVEKAKTIREKTGADYLHLLPSADLIQAKLSEVSAVPETIFVDKAGNLVGESYLGSKSKSQWKKIIESTLKDVQK